MYFLLEKVDFHCQVSLPEGKLKVDSTFTLFIVEKVIHPLKFNILHLKINHWKFWRFRLWKPSFSGSMLVSGRVDEV